MFPRRTCHISVAKQLVVFSTLPIFTVSVRNLWHGFLRRCPGAFTGYFANLCLVGWPTGELSVLTNIWPNWPNNAASVQVFLCSHLDCAEKI